MVKVHKYFGPLTSPHRWPRRLTEGRRRGRRLAEAEARRPAVEIEPEREAEEAEAQTETEKPPAEIPSVAETP